MRSRTWTIVRIAVWSVAAGVGLQYVIALAASLRLNAPVPGSGFVVPPSRADWAWVGAGGAGWAREPWMCGEEAWGSTWDWRVMADPFEAHGSRGAGIYQAGYPMRSLIAAEAWKRDELGQVAWVAQPLGRVMGLGQPGRSWCIPLRPIWPGMAVDAGAAAVLAAVAQVGYLIVRARLRVRRGLCSACGYDVRGVQRCPECGLETASGERGKLAPGA